MELKTWQKEVVDSLTKKRLTHAVLVIADVNDWSEIRQSYQDILKIDKFDSHFLTNEEGDGKIKIKPIKSWLSRLNLAARRATGKLGVILGVEKLTNEAANALLKTIEEPPANTRLLLLASRDNLLPTIRSRVKVYYVEVQSAETNKLSREVMPKNVSDIIKTAEKYRSGQLGEEQLNSWLHELAGQLRQGGCRAALVEDLLNLTMTDNAGVNRRLQIEGILIKYVE